MLLMSADITLLIDTHFFIQYICSLIYDLNDKTFGSPEVFDKYGVLELRRKTV